MGRYSVEIKGSALKALERLPADRQDEIRAAIRKLSDDPRPSGNKRLRGKAGLWRIRAGDYRIVYTIRDDVLVVLVVRVGHRREVYRGL